MKQSVTVGAQLFWGGRYGCNNCRYGCTIVMSYIEINKAVPQWLLTFNLCVSVTGPLTCAFHIPCMHTPEIIDMHRGMCDNSVALDLACYQSEKGLNTLRPRRNIRHFAYGSFKCIFLGEYVLISIEISLAFVPKGPIFQYYMMIILLTHIWVTRPEWVTSYCFRKIWHTLWFQSILAH